MSTQAMSRHTVTKSLELVTAGDVRLSRSSSGKTLTLVSDHPRPLVVMLSWVHAERKNLLKYCDFYLERGVDVLTVYLTAWQMMWPVTGSQVVAEEVLQFLLDNKACQPLFLHGFSVGGYLWGEVLVKMKQDLHRYQPILDRFEGQVWDSVADVVEAPVGVPYGVFPKNSTLRALLAMYIRLHLRVFYELTTKHHTLSFQTFHKNLVHCPALMLLSRADTIGTEATNLKLKAHWESDGIKVQWKCWEDSKHVSHFMKYKDEYNELLENFYANLKEKSMKSEGACKNSL